VADRIVIDASIAIAYLRAEMRSADVQRALTRWAQQGMQLFVTSFFWVEVLNVLVRRHGWDAATVAEGMLELDRLEMRAVDVDRPLLLLAAAQMETWGLSAYDAAYLALALAVDARLATLDDRLASAAGDRAIRPGSGPRSIAEPAVPYARPQALAAWAHSAVVGAHLAELRAQVRGAPTGGR
jgi:predicted nucleic acid-binding protein